MTNLFDMNISLILNCILIKNKVRSLYIYDNSNDVSIEVLSKLFPTLHFEKTSSLNSDDTKYDILISNEKINISDYDTDLKLGQLLGYPTADHFPISREDQKNIGYYQYNVKVDLIKNTKVILFSFLAKDASKDEAIHLFLSKIQEALQSDPISKFIKDIYILKAKKTITHILQLNFLH
jgi:hypothetical protein